MSYRISASNMRQGDRGVEGRKYHQIYGNNDFPPRLREYLVKNGAYFDTDDCFYDFEVKDIQALFDVMYEIHNEQVEDDSYWDFKPPVTFKTDNAEQLLSYLDYKLDGAVVLTMYNFYNAFRKSIEYYWDDETNEPKYKLRNGSHIYLSGY